MQFVLRRDGQHQRHQRATAGCDDDAGEQQPGLRPGPVAVGEAEDDEHRSECTDERKAVDPGGGKSDEDGQHCSDTCAPRDPEHIGVGQRIP